MKRHKHWWLFCGVVATLLLQACVAVKPYQRYYLNDYEMRSGSKPEADFENYVHNIREGSSEAGGAKANGGCGCN